MTKPLFPHLLGATFVCAISQVAAQAPVIPIASLHQQLHAAADAPARIQALHALGTAYLPTNLDSSDSYFTAALAQSTQHNRVGEQAAAQLGLGNVGLRRMAAAKNPKPLATVTEQHLGASISLFEGIFSEKDAPAAQLPLANAYCGQGELHHKYYEKYEPAYAYAEKAMAIADKTDDRATRIRAYILASDCANKLPQRQELALGYNLKALQLARESQDSTLIITAYSRVANAYVERKDYQNANKYLDEAQQTLSALKDKIALAPVYLQQGLVYIEENKPQKAIDRLTEVLNMARKIDGKETMISSYVLLEKAAKSIGDTQNAQKYHQLAEDLRNKQRALTETAE